MATAESRTSSLGGILDSNNGPNVGIGSQGSFSGSGPSHSSGKTRRSAGENSEWRRKVKSVDLDTCESGTASGASAFLRQSLTESHRSSDHLSDSAQEWMKRSLRISAAESSSTGHATVDLNTAHNSGCGGLELMLDKITPPE
ncbi:hypothetical protein E1301_Tti015529 [Triplophysa tibetana]|uniref:Uncharacterized protein n=1 Tax=Triplophysa tibetana TaxID=1572043 RepID=A0A5A9N3A3_9TELE|nr:hypothetical protein E1301_Tti015529 [Triplophysa tibetana]